MAIRMTPHDNQNRLTTELLSEQKSDAIVIADGASATVPLNFGDTPWRIVASSNCLVRIGPGSVDAGELWLTGMAEARVLEPGTTVTVKAI